MATGLLNTFSYSLSKALLFRLFSTLYTRLVIVVCWWVIVFIFAHSTDLLSLLLPFASLYAGFIATMPILFCCLRSDKWTRKRNFSTVYNNGIFFLSLLVPAGRWIQFAINRTCIFFAQLLWVIWLVFWSILYQCSCVEHNEP